MRKIGVIICLLIGLFLGLYLLHPQSVLTLFSKPEVIIIPGYGSGLTPQDYSYISTNVTRQGYTVLKYTPTYGDISNYGHLMDVWTQGVAREVGTKQVVVIGHSVGGAVAMHYCATHTQCVASINLDGRPAHDEIIHAPNMYLYGEAGAYCDTDCLQGRILARQITTESKGIQIFMPGLKHLNFTDFAINQAVHTDLSSQGYFGAIDGKTGLNQINQQISIFIHGLQ